MNIKKMSITGIVLLFISSTAIAEESINGKLKDILDRTSFNSAISFNNKNLDITVGDNLSVKPVFNTLDLALNASMDKYFLSLSYGASINKTAISSGQADMEFSRTDLSITGGYRFKETLSIFGGLLTGETNVDFINVTTVPANTFLTEKLTSNGPYIGISYNHPAMRLGSISGNIAFASLEGEDKLTDDIGSNTDFGTTSGFSFGAKWSGDLRGEMAYFISVKLNRFTFKSNATNFESDENYTIVSLGVSNYF